MSKSMPHEPCDGNALLRRTAVLTGRGDGPTLYQCKSFVPFVRALRRSADSLPRLNWDLASKRKRTRW